MSIPTSGFVAPRDVADAIVDELGFAARLTAADPDAVRKLTTFLDRAANASGGRG